MVKDTSLIFDPESKSLNDFLVQKLGYTSKLAAVKTENGAF